MDKALLFKARLPEAEVDVPGVGTVRVRALSRADVLAMRASEVEDAPGAFERMLLAAAMVDPVLTAAEVGEWQGAAAADELDVVVAKVNELSALGKESAKAAYKEFDANPATEFRVHPGAEVGDDGDPVA